MPTVTYSRNHKIERETRFVLVGSTRWLRDLELILEDAWPQCYLSDRSPKITTFLKDKQINIALVEATEDFDETKKFIESVLPSSVMKAIICTENLNPFLVKKYSNYTARTNIPICHMPEDAVVAATEIEPYLLSWTSNISNELSSIIDRAELVLEGFAASSVVTSISSSGWKKECEKTCAWLFQHITLSTIEFRLIRILSLAHPLYAVRHTWSHQLLDVFEPIEAYSHKIGTEIYVRLAVSITQIAQKDGKNYAESVSKAIKGSSLGLLMRRTLNQHVNDLVKTGQNRQHAKKVG